MRVLCLQEGVEVGKIKVQRGQKLFKLNKRTKIPRECVLAEKDGGKGDYAHVKGQDYVLPVQKNYVYLPALNKENAKKQYEKRFRSKKS